MTRLECIAQEQVWLLLKCESLMPSTVIRSFQYDEHSRTLLIVFQSGRRYRYLDVPAELINQLRRAFAKGEFFNAHIRGRYAYKEQPLEAE